MHRCSQQLQDVFCIIGGQKNFMMVCTNVNRTKFPRIPFPVCIWLEMAKREVCVRFGRLKWRCTCDALKLGMSRRWPWSSWIVLLTGWLALLGRSSSWAYSPHPSSHWIAFCFSEALSHCFFCKKPAPVSRLEEMKDRTLSSWVQYVLSCSSLSSLSSALGSGFLSNSWPTTTSDHQYTERRAAALQKFLHQLPQLHNVCFLW